MPPNLSPPAKSGVHAPEFVTPDSIGGPCLLPSPYMDTRVRGYDKGIGEYDKGIREYDRGIRGYDRFGDTRSSRA